jgi:hypothetical protein
MGLIELRANHKRRIGSSPGIRSPSLSDLGRAAEWYEGPQAKNRKRGDQILRGCRIAILPLVGYGAGCGLGPG